MMYPSLRLHLLCGLGTAALAAASTSGQNNTTMITDWYQLTPSEDINWVSCFDNYTCTRLIVPLDYEDSSAGTAAISLMKFAAVNETKATKTVLFNPGGPGGPGTLILPLLATWFRSFVGPDWNVVSFDPRGVLASEPSLDCFHRNNTLNYNFFQIVNNLNPSVSAEDFNALFELVGAYGNLCDQELNKSAAYVGTPAVARDMITIVEKVAGMNGDKPEEALVNYFGGSYGSILGATFATLYPDRVGRFMIDAIGSGEDYFEGTWLSSNHDADEAESTFFSLCHRAGPDRCAFYDNAPEKIENRYRKLLIQLKDNPIAVWDKSVTEVPSLATYGQLKGYFLQSTYKAEMMFPGLAQVLADLEKRNGTSLLAATGPPCYDCDNAELGYQDSLALIGIKCTDADARYNVSTREAWKGHLDTSISLSPYAGDSMAGSALLCRKWPFRPPPSQKFDGKWGAKTKTPLLILSNELDPVCPIRNAYKVASLFPQSVVLKQNAVGHGTVTARSNCTAKYTREYFRSGKLPPANTTCEPNTRPFFGIGTVEL